MASPLLIPFPQKHCLPEIAASGHAHFKALPYGQHWEPPVSPCGQYGARAIQPPHPGSAFFIPSATPPLGHTVLQP